MHIDPEELLEFKKTDAEIRLRIGLPYANLTNEQWEALYTHTKSMADKLSHTLDEELVKLLKEYSKGIK